MKDLKQLTWLIISIMLLLVASKANAVIPKGCFVTNNNIETGIMVVQCKEGTTKSLKVQDKIKIKKNKKKAVEGC